VADAMLRSATGLSEPGRPLATFLALGPSGTGKTTLAKAAAEVLTGDVERMIRFDMSEYADPYGPARLLADDDHSLVGRLRAMPAGVLLLDEIEKAHGNVVRMLLQALGESRLTSAEGATVRLDNHLVMMTSNLGGSRWAGRTEGRGLERIRRGVLSDCAAFFPTEFLGRLTGILLYRPLDRATAERIVMRELDALNDTPGLVERGLQVVYGPGLPSQLTRIGVSGTHGARGVQRVVRTAVASPLARWLADQPDLRDGVLMLAPCSSRGELESVSIDFVAEGMRPAGITLH
jgi:ATP-dependent Clp protease ATP-binding subunit ClpA